MTTVLVFLTIVEIMVAVAVLAAYVILVTRRLRTISQYLGKIAFGVRAVDTQTSSIGPSVLRLSATLEEVRAALVPLVDKADRAARG